MFLQLKGQLLDKLFTKGGGEGWLAFCCLALCTLHSCNGYWNGKVKRKGIVSENSEDIYIFFHIPLLLFWLHTCSSPRLTNGSQGSCRTSIFISYIIYVCVYKYVSHLRLWGSFMYECVWVFQLSKHPKRNEKHVQWTVLARQ